MKLKGEDVSEGLRDWVKAELKEGPRQGYDLGKFCFTVSAGTIGAITAIERLNTSSEIDLPMALSLISLFISILIAVVLSCPRKHSIGGETDLLAEYNKQVDRVIRAVSIWFALWLFGTICGGFAVRT